GINCGVGSFSQFKREFPNSEFTYSYSTWPRRIGIAIKFLPRQARILCLGRHKQRFGYTQIAAGTRVGRRNKALSRGAPDKGSIVGEGAIGRGSLSTLVRLGRFERNGQDVVAIVPGRSAVRPSICGVGERSCEWPARIRRGAPFHTRDSWRHVPERCLQSRWNFE